MNKWTPVSDGLPKHTAPVLAVLDTPKRIVIRACYIPRFARSGYSYDDGILDWNEEDGEEYWPEGWYECSESGEYDNTLLSDRVTHWMALPPLPEDQP